MPISYEPQQAFDERTFAAYGAAMAREKDRDFALRAGAQAQQAAHQSSALAQADEHFTEQQRQQANLAYAHMGQQAALQADQHAAAFEMQQQRQNFEFTQADNLRLQRLNQDAAGWESLNQSGEITKEEYQQGIQMLNQGRMPLQARRDAAQEQHIRKQNQLIATQQAAQVTRDDAHRRFYARTGPLASPDGEWVQTGPEKWQHITEARPTIEITPQIRARFATTARAEQAREEQFAARAGQPAPAWAASAQTRDLDRQRRVNEMIRDHSGSGGGTRADAASQDQALSNLATGIVNRILPNVAPQQPAAPMQQPGAPSPVGFPAAEGMS